MCYYILISLKGISPTQWTKNSLRGATSSALFSIQGCQEQLRRETTLFYLGNHLQKKKNAQLIFHVPLLSVKLLSSWFLCIKLMNVSAYTVCLMSILFCKQILYLPQSFPTTSLAVTMRDIKQHRRLQDE